jgi:hypothetical protein
MPLLREGTAVQMTKSVRGRAPLLEQEGWREAPGWSLTDNRSDSIPAAFQ